MKMETIKVLNDSEINDIHEASLKLLSQTGMRIDSPNALKLLKEAGAQVDFETSSVKIPKDLVEDSLASVPEEVNLYNSRTKEISCVLGGYNPLPTAGGDALYFLDYEGKRRKIKKTDVAKFTKVADSLENIEIVVPAGIPQDVSHKAPFLHGIDAVFSNTGKPLYFPHEGAEVTKTALEIARVVSGEKDQSKHPIMVFHVSPTSPLCWVEGAVDSLIETAKAGVPCCILPQPLSGMTGPYSVAGQIVMNTAEVLSGIVISQIVNKGVPMVYGQAWITYDMQKNHVIFSSPETILERIAGNQLAKFYKMPTMMDGSDTESWSLDAQSGIEKGLTGFAVYSCGANIITDFGEIASVTVASCEQLVIDSEIFDYVTRLNKGVDVSKESMAVDVVNKVGPGGNFMTEQHTLDNLRTEEYWKPGIFSPSNYETWISEGSPDLAKKANQKVNELLDSYQPKPLEEKKQQEIKSIIEEFESRT